jgi:hypothetical protein
MKNRNRSVGVSLFQASSRCDCKQVKTKVAQSASGEHVTKSPSVGLVSLCKEIAGTLIRRYADTGDPRGACDEVHAVLTDKLDCDPDRAIAMIDLALELIRLNSYGEYRRNDLEMSLLVSKAAGHLGEAGLN